MTLTPELGYVGVLFLLFVVPRALQRFGIPAAITSLGLGALSGMGFGLLQHDATIHLLSAFGIVALFLFAGLEVDTEDLRANAVVLVQHLAVKSILLAGVTWALLQTLQLDYRVALLVALALLTPSTGFILDALEMLGLVGKEKTWIKSKAIAAELLALLVLFATLQSTTASTMAISTAVLAGMIIILPLVFRVFAKLVVPYAPRSEFAFLLMVAVVCAFVTRELGVYYLVGAFVVGMAAQRFRAQLPSLASEEMIRAVELFASFFIPFYFFNAGVQLRREDFALQALLYGGGFLVAMIPLRVAAVAIHRMVALGEPLSASLLIAVPMLPTLVFGLVIAEILRDRFAAPPPLFGGIILYTLLVTVVPAMVFKSKVPDYAEPHAPKMPTP